jgi:hypothetical protein
MGRAQRNPSLLLPRMQSDGFRKARHRARVRATRWLYPSYALIAQVAGALKLAAPVAVAVLHEIGPAIPAYVAVPVMFFLGLSQIILGRRLELR